MTRGLLILAVMLWGCAEPPPPAAVEPAVTAPRAHKPNVFKGAVIYKTYCAQCHQPDGKGLDGKKAADFTRPGGRLTKPDAQLQLSIRDGVNGEIGAMPAWGEHLDDSQIDDVLAYIRRRFDPAREGR